MPGHFAFECPLCEEPFRGDDLAAIAKRGARHYNAEHGRELRHHYERIDVEEWDGRRIHGDEYAVKRRDIYITAFDVMERIGKADGLLVPAGDTEVCCDCCRILEDEEGVEVAPEDYFDDRLRCPECVEQAEIDRRRETNRDLGAFAEGDG